MLGIYFFESLFREKVNGVRKREVPFVQRIKG